MSSDTRSRILEAAAGLLAQSGGAGVRMSDIARRAGVSRQAVYLHFDTRAELLIAVTRHIDEALGLDARLEPSRAARKGAERMRAYIAFWGAYLPEIHPVARALIAMQDSDPAASEAWDGRMAALREGCAAAIAALDADGELAPVWTADIATDLFWSMLSVPVWEALTQQRGWSTEDYVDRVQTQALRTFRGRGKG